MKRVEEDLKEKKLVVHVTPEQFAALMTIKAKTLAPVSATVRRAIDEYLERNAKK